MADKLSRRQIMKKNFNLILIIAALSTDVFAGPRDALIATTKVLKAYEASFLRTRAVKYMDSALRNDLKNTLAILPPTEKEKMLEELWQIHNDGISVFQVPRFKTYYSSDGRVTQIKKESAGWGTTLKNPDDMHKKMEKIIRNYGSDTHINPRPQLPTQFERDLFSSLSTPGNYRSRFIKEASGGKGHLTLIQLAEARFWRTEALQSVYSALDGPRVMHSVERIMLRLDDVPKEKMLEDLEKILKQDKNKIDDIKRLVQKYEKQYPKNKISVQFEDPVQSEAMPGQ